ncbi:MAG: Hpt domain-containing protein [Campylobacterota bacterium]|nr:Hpt domain-containing protein [Campylobacterota bacterium]
MLIYNYQKEFIGIDEADLEVFGFTNLSELKAEAADFADMFVRTPGYIHNFKHVHWIDFVTCSDPSEESKVIIEVNSKTFKANLDIETLYLSENPTSKAYVIHLNNLRGLTVKENGDISEDVARKRPTKVEPTVGFAFNAPQDSEESHQLDIPAPTQELPELEGFKPFEKIDKIEDIVEKVTEVQSDEPLDISFDDEPIESTEEPLLSTTETIEEKIPKEDAPIEIEDAYTEEDSLEVVTTLEATPGEKDDFDYSYNYDPQVASDELGLPIDLIEEFIEDFIAQAHEFKDDLFNSLHDDDLENVKVLSHKLKGVAANLRIEDAFNTLSIINTSSDITEVESHLNIFYKIIAKLSGEQIQTTQKSEAPVVEVASTETKDESDLYDDDLIIDFKDVNTENPLKEEVAQEDETYDIGDDIEIAIEDDEKNEIEIQDSEVPQKIEMPELADDEFLNDPTETEDDINIDDLLSVDIDDEKPSSVKEVSDLEEALETTEEFAVVQEEKALDFEYSKEAIASEIGLDQESFNEIFEDYILDSKLAIEVINEAIINDDYTKRRQETLKLKGMSDNMRVNDFNDQFDTLLNSSDRDELTNAITKIDATIAQISK